MIVFPFHVYALEQVLRWRQLMTCLRNGSIEWLCRVCVCVCVCALFICLRMNCERHCVSEVHRYSWEPYK